MYTRFKEQQDQDRANSAMSDLPGQSDRAFSNLSAMNYKQAKQTVN